MTSEKKKGVFADAMLRAGLDPDKAKTSDAEFNAISGRRFEDDMTPETKLEPCPWCKGPIECIDITSRQEAMQKVSVNGPHDFIFRCEACRYSLSYDTRSQATQQKNWNTRAPSKADKVLGKVKEELKQKPYLGFDGIEAAEHLEFLIKQWEQES